MMVCQFDLESFDRARQVIRAALRVRQNLIAFWNMHSSLEEDFMLCHMGILCYGIRGFIRCIAQGLLRLFSVFRIRTRQLVEDSSVFEDAVDSCFDYRS